MSLCSNITITYKNRGRTFTIIQYFFAILISEIFIDSSLFRLLLFFTNNKKILFIIHYIIHPYKQNKMLFILQMLLFYYKCLLQMLFILRSFHDLGLMYYNLLIHNFIC